MKYTILMARQMKSQDFCFMEKKPSHSTLYVGLHHGVTVFPDGIGECTAIGTKYLEMFTLIFRGGEYGLEVPTP
jgi:hypothetical protein